MSCATRNPSRVVASMKVPVSASRGANATACTRMSKPSQRDFKCAKPRAMSSSLATSMAKVMSECSERARGTTRSAMRSMYENASSAPSRCMAWAIPQAMERSVARPTIRARLPLRKPILSPLIAAGAVRAVRARTPASLPLLPARVDVHDEPLSGSDLMILVDAVPTLQLCDRDLELMRDAEYRIAAPHRVERAPAALDAFVAIAPRARFDDKPLALGQGIAELQVVQARERAHRNAVAPCDAAQSLAGANSVNELPLLATGIGFRPVDPLRGEQHFLWELYAHRGNLHGLPRGHAPTG